MAENMKLGVEIEVKSDAEGPIKSIKSQLKDAKNELNAVIDRFGAMSPEAAKAASKVAQLEDKIGDAKKLSDAFNPDAKFKGLTGAIQGAVGAFTGLQGAMALFGDKNKAVEETLVKLQGAMALSQGINSVLEAGDSFKALGAVIKSTTIFQKASTAAQWLWNAAMEANPIGAIIVVVAALIAGIVALTSWLIKSADAAKEDAKAVDTLHNKIKDQTRSMELSNAELERSQNHEIALAKAKGETTAQIRTREKKLMDEKVAQMEANKALASNTWHEAMNLLAKKKAEGASEDKIKQLEEEVKKSGEANDKATENLNKAYNDRKDLNNRHIEEIAAENTAANKKAADDRKKANDDALNAQKDADAILYENKLKGMTAQQREEAELLKKHTEEQNKLKKAGYKDTSAIDEQYEKDKQAIADRYAKEAADKKKKDDEEKAKAELEYQNKVLAIQDETDKLTKQLQDKNISDEKTRRQQAIEDKYQEEIDAALKILDDTNLKVEDRQRLYDERRAAVDQKYREDKAANAANDALKELDIILNSNDAKYNAKKKALDDEEALLKDSNIRKALGEDEYNKRVKALADARNKIHATEVQNRRQGAKDIGNSLGQLADVIGKQTVAGKSLAIGQATINTYLGATEALKQKSTLPSPYDYVAKALNVTAIILSGLKSVKEIVKTPIPGGGGGSEPSAANVMGAGAPIGATPETTILPQAQIDQIASANAATRAYVVESDVTTNQERITRLNRAARIN